MIELWTIYTLRKYLSSRICHTDKVFMALVTSPFSWTYYVRAFPVGWALLKLGCVTMISFSWL